MPVGEHNSNDLYIVDSNYHAYDTARIVYMYYDHDDSSKRIVVFSLPKLLLFITSDLVIERPEKYGGRVTFSTYKQLEEAYVKEEVFPLDLKNSVANQLNKVYLCSGVC